ncbi:MAG: Kelch repeat-containing protein [Gemmatimonadales bacterium]
MSPRPTLEFALPLTVLALLACGETTTPTQPDMGGDPAALSLAAATNSWTPRAPTPFSEEFYGYDLGMAPNAAGQSIVYTFGGTDGEGGTGFSVQAYNVTTDTWTGKLSRVGVFHSNGVGKIGGKLYFSGGYNEVETPPSFSNLVWAYDYSRDRMIRKADLPIFSAEGVTGVINGKLYVLPGACSGERYPNAGYCAEEPTRRFYRYDPATNTWVSRRQAPHFHRQGAAAVIDGKLYVVGGHNNFTPVADLDVYDPGTNSWRSLAPIPTAGGAAGAALGGQFYVVVQQFSGASFSYRFYAYNRFTNQWKEKAAPSFDQGVGAFRGKGSVTKVTLDGRPRLFMATGDQSALYTP